MKNQNQVSYFGDTNMGRQRTNNEDAYIAEQLNDTTILAAAIDGVGGYEGGEVAAEIARTEIPRFLRQFRNGERLELLKQAVVSANNAIFERRQTDDSRPNMSCVLTSALIDVKHKVISMVHVGDTRLYQFRHHQLVKLSHDHSLVGYREEMGDLTEEQAMHHPQRNVISRDVGSDHHEVADHDFLEAADFPLLPNSTLLFCSDGLTDLITSAQIISVLEQNISLKQKTAALIQLANEAGGKDNITVVLVEYLAPEAKPVAPTAPVAANTPKQTPVQPTPPVIRPVPKKSNRIWYILGCILLGLLLLFFGYSYYRLQKGVPNNLRPYKDIELNEPALDDFYLDDFEPDSALLPPDVKSASDSVSPTPRTVEELERIIAQKDSVIRVLQSRIDSLESR